MTPTDLQDLQAVRAAAERIDSDDYGDCDHDSLVIADYILATIPPDCQLAITAEWLSDVWGCQPMVEHGITYWTFPNCEAVWENKGKWYLSGVDGAKLSNRHEATTLFTALGIQPRGITPKEGE